MGGLTEYIRDYSFNPEVSFDSFVTSQGNASNERHL
jgi:hypothetical protein